MDEIIRWIETNPFKKLDSCDCDFNGDWLGNGNCIGCHHPISYFKEGWCTFPVMYGMTAKEMKEEIIKYLKEYKEHFED